MSWSRSCCNGLTTSPSNFTRSLSQNSPKQPRYSSLLSKADRPLAVLRHSGANPVIVFAHVVIEGYLVITRRSTPPCT